MRKRDDLSRRAFRMWIGLTCSICVPAICSFLFLVRSARPDLSDLAPATANSGGHILIAWRDLERGRGALRTGGVSTGTLVRALGYMMAGAEPVPDGQFVGHFVLLPGAGNAWHPAHRFGDQMLDVRLQEGGLARFSEGHLVWVWGTLRALPGDPAGPEPLYVLENARTEPADQSEIPKYFR